MEPSLAKSTEHAKFVNKQFLRAEELYDANSLDECVKIHRNLMLKHYTAPGFAPLKTHMRLCELSDWKYANACRQGAEHLYEVCSKYPERYDPGVLAEFRAPLDALAETWANKPVSEMSDEEIHYRLKKIGGIKINVTLSTGQTSEQIAEMVRIAKRQTLENHHAKRRVQQESHRSE